MVQIWRRIVQVQLELGVALAFLRSKLLASEEASGPICDVSSSHLGIPT